jgi:hypothetical protein
MGGKAARTKGSSFERFIATEIRSIDPHARRNVSETQQASVDITTCLPLAIQCKALKNWSLSPHAIYAQAASGAVRSTDVPVGIVKIDKRQPKLVLIALEHFLELINALYGKEAKNNPDLIQLKSWLSGAEAASTTQASKS